MRLKLLQVLMISAATVALQPAAAALAQPAAATGARPEGWSDRSYYLTMRDGVKVAISLYFPGGVEPKAKAPVMLLQTRYGRATEARYGEHWRKAGYVVAIVDTRGSTASFGPRAVDIGPEEVRDTDEIVAHLAAQPWSNGQVVASGVSYSADTADRATSRAAPALIAAVPRQTDFDAYTNLFYPGGVTNDYMLNGWGGYTREIDQGRDGRDAGLDCAKRAEDCAKLFPTLQPVDEDPDRKLLREAVSGRTRWGPDDYAGALFRDQKGLNGYTMFSSSPAADLAGIRAQKKPVQYWGSWMDAGTAAAALDRFRSAPEVPAEVWITANNHGGNVGADPFDPVRKAPLPSADEQFASHFAFVDRVRAGQKIERAVNYYVLGAGTYRKSASWPPAGMSDQRLFLDAGGKLSNGKGAAGVDRYDVDFTASTGKATRWTTNFGAPPAYPDRREADAKLIVYDGPAMTQDMELAGYPVVKLKLASLSSDPAVFAYLEDVAPDGRVTYITEGQFRAIHRKPADPARLPYDQGPAPHSFDQADALLVTPGEAFTLEFALAPTAALIRKGHRLRLAIGGADADTFHRFPESGPERFEIHRGADSSVALPMRAWRP